MGLLGEVKGLRKQLDEAKPLGRVHIIWIDEGETKEQARARYRNTIQDTDVVHYLSFLGSHEMTEEEINATAERDLRDDRGRSDRTAEAPSE